MEGDSYIETGMGGDPLLEMRSISKSFPGVRALTDVDFRVNRGEVRCLIGANGAGKSTLMKILTGAYPKDAGTIVFEGREAQHLDPVISRGLGIAAIYQELSLVDTLTVAENIFLNNYGFGKPSRHVDWKRMRELALGYFREFNIHVDPGVSVGELSIGARQIVEIVKALASDAKLIIMDEPSATLSRDEFETLLKIIGALREKGITIIYISHRLEELYSVGDSITVLRDGRHIRTAPIGELPIPELVKLMIGHEITARAKRRERPDSRELIRLEDVSTRRLSHIDLGIREGEIHGLYGLVGSGRTEVLRAIYGIDRLTGGRVLMDDAPFAPKSPNESVRRKMGLAPENRKVQGLVMSLPVWENASMVSLRRFTKRGVINYRRLFEECEGMVRRLLIATPGVRTRVSSLSGGNQQKVVLSKWLMTDSRVLLIDEPTQGIDVGAKEEIYKQLELIADEGKTIVVVSSELEELLSFCDRISVMYEGSLVRTFSSGEMDDKHIQHCAITGRSDT